MDHSLSQPLAGAAMRARRDLSGYLLPHTLPEPYELYTLDASSPKVATCSTLPGPAERREQGRASHRNVHLHLPLALTLLRL